MSDTKRVLKAIQGLAIQLFEIEKRLQNLEAKQAHPLLQLLPADTDSEDDGYESAPPTFSAHST